MRFGPLALDEAEAAIAAHSVKLPSGIIKKGTRLDATHVAALRAAGIESVVAARLDPGDVHEDEAARRVAEMLAGANLTLEPAFTGRCNLHAATGGLLTVDRRVIDAFNRIDPGLTVATLAEHTPVEPGRMVATVKIIPFCVPEAALDAARRMARSPGFAVAPWRGLRVGLAATMLPGLKASVMDKTRAILEARLAAGGARLTREMRVAHDVPALAGALAELAAEADLTIAFGASAITDEADVIPAAIRAAGGEVVHFGMPVDPGNLLLLGRLAGRPVIGAPGCARSPVENGFDWILHRLLAGLEVTPEVITGMGVGGLLMEIVSRPQPRQPAATDAGVAAVILAAGQARRMGGPNKLTARFDGVPLVRRIAERALASRAGPVIVVTGHRADEVAEAVAGLEVRLVHNAAYADGLATSLRTGLGEVPEAAGALVILADMPGITTADIDLLVAAFRAREGKAIVLPTVNGKRGNPVLWPKAFFPELMTLAGDTGARHVIGAHEDAVERVELGAAAGLDVDTPEAVAAAGGVVASAG